MHQLVEYLIGIVLMAASFQSPTPALPAALGGLVLVNAAAAKGGAGAFHLVGRRVHRVLDLLVIGALLAAAVQPWIELELTGRLASAAVGVVLFFVWFHTDFDAPAARATRRRRASDRSEELGRRAGRVVGDGVNAVRRWRGDDDGRPT